MIGYPLESLYREVAYIGYHFHWAIDDILEMEHRERAIWVKQIADINEQINEASGKSG